MSIWTTILDYFSITPRHQHIWKVVSAHKVKLLAAKWVETQEDTVIGYQTDVVLRCTVCGGIRERTLQGHHELKNLQSTENEDQSYGQL